MQLKIKELKLWKKKKNTIKKDDDDYLILDCSSLTKLMHLWVDCFMDVDESDYYVVPTCYSCVIKVGKTCFLKPCDCMELFTQKEPFVYCNFSGTNRELDLIIRSISVTKEGFEIIKVEKDVISRILTSYFNHNVIGSYMASLKVESSPHNKFLITINLIPGFGLISKAKRQIQYEIDYNKSMEMRLIGDRVLRICF